ncbi:MAG: HAD-IC family P-type ATPase [Clostridia bacterium]
MNYSVMTEREIEIELATSVSEGLTSFTAHDRLLDLGRNNPEKTYSKRALTVVLMQFKNLYTLAFIAMGIITLLCDFKSGMGAWILFFAVALSNMVSGFLRDNRERKIAEVFDRKRRENVKIIRDGNLMESDPTLLVRGDVVVLEEGDFVPCDLRVLWCENLKADESFLRNRSVPVEKKSEKMDYEAEGFECDNILYCGTSIARGSARATVIATGKDTLLAKTASKEAHKLDMHNKFAKNDYSEKLLLLVSMLCAIAVIIFVSLKTKDVKRAMITACTISLCLIPAAVSFVRHLAMKYASNKLRKENVKVTDENILSSLGEVEYFLFDKGGMLTDEKMDLEETLIPNIEALDMAVICSDCEFSSGVVKGNSIDTATADYLINKGRDVKKLIEDNPKIHYVPFDEARKLMAVIVKWDDGYRLIVKGSIEVVPTLCTKLTDGENTMDMNGEVLHRIEHASSSMAEKGLKVRAVAYKDLTQLPDDIESEIKDLIFVGLMGYREMVVSKARETVSKLKKVHVKPIMVTGDLTITAATLARQAGIIKSEDECISFRELSDATDRELLSACDKYSVFSSASKEDREKLVRVLGANSKTVAVAGDEMSDGGVSIYSSVTFGEDGDVVTENKDITSVGNVISFVRTIRSNMTCSSFIAVGVGLCEVLVMLYMLFTGIYFNIPTIATLLLNLFVAFVPCLVVSLFAGGCIKPHSQKNTAYECMLFGFIGALLCLIALSAGSVGTAMMFFVYYAIFEAIRRCAWNGNLEKGKSGLIGVIILGIVAVLVYFVSFLGLFGVFTNDNILMAILLAILSCVINGFCEYIKTKGRVS